MDRLFYLLTVNGLTPHVVGPFANYADADEWAADHLDRMQWIFFEGLPAPAAIDPGAAESVIFGEESANV